MVARRTGCYGKLPIFGDFLRHNAGSSSVRAMDQWFQEGYRNCEQTLGRSWGQEFATTAPLRFLFVPAHGGAVLVGALVPGVDKAGRHYPFVVFQEIEGVVSGEQLAGVPLQFDRILDSAEALAVDGYRGMDPSGLYAAVEALGADDAVPGQGLAEVLASTTLGDVLPRVFASEDENGTWVLLQNLADLVQPGARPQYVLAQPGGGSARECSIWLTVYRELNSGQPLPSVVMWGRAAGSSTEAASSSLTRVLFDLVKPVYFQPMLRPDLQSRRLCHMAREGLRSVDRIARARERFGGLLEDESKSLRGFIDEFVALARG